MAINITRDQAKRFILNRQGLLGKYRFVGKNDAYQYVRQAGCIQYDPVERQSGITGIPGRSIRRHKNENTDTMSSRLSMGRIWLEEWKLWRRGKQERLRSGISGMSLG